MHPIHRVRVVAGKYPFLGPLIYILCLQNLTVQYLVAQAWTTMFSLRLNVISDLGNTVCGQYGERYVCSPQYMLMNGSFVLLGLTMAIGSMLIYHEFHRTRLTLIGFTLMGLGGIGSMLVGMYPENTVPALHSIGAVLALGVGNLSLLFLGLGITQAHTSFRVYTFATGIVTVLAFGLYVSGFYLGLGPGGMERLAAYPQTIWLAVLGLYMTLVRWRAKPEGAI